MSERVTRARALVGALRTLVLNIVANRGLAKEGFTVPVLVWGNMSTTGRGSVNGRGSHARALDGALRTLILNIVANGVIASLVLVWGDLSAAALAVGLLSSSLDEGFI